MKRTSKERKSVDKTFKIAEMVLAKIHDSGKHGFSSKLMQEFCQNQGVDSGSTRDLISKYTAYKAKDDGNSAYPFYFLNPEGLEFIKNGCWSGEKKRENHAKRARIATLVVSILGVAAAIITLILSRCYH
jgi:hypothetical protein